MTTRPGYFFVAKLFFLFSLLALVHSSNNFDTSILSSKCGEEVRNLSGHSAVIVWEGTGKGFKEWGNYEVCVNHGYEYCMVLFKVVYPEQNNNISIQEEIGICAPPACTPEDVRIIASAIATDFINLTKLDVSITHINPSCADSPSYSAGAIVLFCIISILLFLLVAGTTLDFYLRYDDRIKSSIFQTNYFECRREEEKILDEEESSKNLVERESMQEENPRRNRNEVVLDRSVKGFLLCWSALYNLEKLFVPTPGPLVCLNGIRVISMFYIILGHSFAFINLEALDDLDTFLQDIKDHFLFQIAPAAFYAVDSFFFISALLVTYLTMGELRKKGRISLVMFYFHRFWRLTPALALLMFIYWQIIPGLSSGPWWNLETSTIATTCHKYWWSTLLYIQNFYPNSMTQECMGWTWYLANDTQFYVLTPIALYLFYYRKYFGWALIITLILGCLGVNLFLTIYYDFTYYFQYYFLSQNQEYFNYLYIKPYARAFPWLVGIGLGFIFHDYGFKFKLGTVTVTIGYFLSFLTIALLVFLPYNDYHNAVGYYSKGYWSEGFNVFFLSFSRLFWSLALAWIVWACAVGYGGPLNWFLGHPWWAFGARLTYTAYLWHPMIIKIYWASITSPMFYSPFFLIVWYIAFVTLAFFFALLVFLTIERPSMNLERIILPHSRG